MTRQYSTVAYNALLFPDTTQAGPGVCGVALRDPEGCVFFQQDGTGLWQELYDGDAARLQLLGRCDLSLCQAIRDGNLVMKPRARCSASRNSPHGAGEEPAPPEKEHEHAYYRTDPLHRCHRLAGAHRRRAPRWA